VDFQPLAKKSATQLTSRRRYRSTTGKAWLTVERRHLQTASIKSRR